MRNSNVSLIQSLPCAEHGHSLPPVDAAALAVRTVTTTPVALVLAVSC